MQRRTWFLRAARRVAPLAIVLALIGGAAGASVVPGASATSSTIWPSFHFDEGRPMGARC